jgi:hypothetical protein
MKKCAKRSWIGKVSRHIQAWSWALIRALIPFLVVFAWHHQHSIDVEFQIVATTTLFLLIMIFWMI